MNNPAKKLILASASPRRKKLLEDAGYTLKVIVPEVEEISPPEGDPHEVARVNSIAKAEAVAAAMQEGLVVASDTVVALGKEIIGKPADKDDACRILERLSGTRHCVVSSVTIIDVATNRSTTATDGTFVTMRSMSAREITEYVDSGEALGKAGAYAIQETADRFVERIEGSFSTVVGFPLEMFEEMLAEFTARLEE